MFPCWVVEKAVRGQPGRRARMKLLLEKPLGHAERAGPKRGAAPTWVKLIACSRQRIGQRPRQLNWTARNPLQSTLRDGDFSRPTGVVLAVGAVDIEGFTYAIGLDQFSRQSDSAFRPLIPRRRIAVPIHTDIAARRRRNRNASSESVGRIHGPPGGCSAARRSLQASLQAGRTHVQVSRSGEPRVAKCR